MTKVLVFGIFDGLHEGHLAFLKQAKEYGDCLVVVVGRDSTVKKNKNKTPKYNEQERLEKIRNSDLVNEALLGQENHDPKTSSYSLIKEINPDVICLGYDQIQYAEKLKDELNKMGLKAEVKTLKPYQPEKYHSSILNE